MPAEVMVNGVAALASILAAMHWLALAIYADFVVLPTAFV